MTSREVSGDEILAAPGAQTIEELPEVETTDQILPPAMNILPQNTKDQEDPKVTMIKGTVDLAVISGDSSGALATDNLEIAVKLSAISMTEED